MERRAKAHFGREHPIAASGLAEFAAGGSGERVLTRRAQEGNEQRRLRHGLGDDDGFRRDNKRLNGRAATLRVTAFLALAPVVALSRTVVVVMRSCRVLVSFGVVSVFSVVGVAVFVRGH